MNSMKPEARRALQTIRRCVATDRVRLTQHFRVRLTERGLVWPDLLTVMAEPADVKADGHDDWSRPRWIISGDAADGLAVKLVCVIGHDATGKLAVFITMHWER